MAQIHALSSKPANAKDMQQMVRWVNTKEDHASKVIKTIAEYFLTQKQATCVTSTGAARDIYLNNLALHHAVMVAAMKTKQNVDAKFADELDSAIHALKHVYNASHSH
jgi:nickel superoxide dismutase